MHPRRGAPPGQPARGAPRRRTRCGCARPRRGFATGDRRHRADRRRPRPHRRRTSPTTWRGCSPPAPPSSGKPVGAGDVAVLISSLKHVGLFQTALSDRGIPSVVSGGSSVLLTEAGDDWLVLLEALEQPHRSARVRVGRADPVRRATPRASSTPAATTSPTTSPSGCAAGWTCCAAAASPPCTRRSIADGLRGAGARRARGRAAADRPRPPRPGAPRRAAPRGPRPPGAAGLAARRAPGAPRPATSAPVVWTPTRGGAARHHPRAARGCSTPSSTCRSLFNKWPADDDRPRSSTTDGRAHRRRRRRGPIHRPRRARRAAGEELRLTYVALTRAQSQVVTWWAPTWDAGHAGLTRLLFGRERRRGRRPRHGLPRSLRLRGARPR